MKRSLLIGLIVGLIVMLASFELMGGTPVSLSQPKMLGFITPVELWSGLMGLFGGAGTLFFSWMKNSMSMTLNNFDNNNTSEHKKLFTTFNDISKSVHQLIDNLDTEKKYEKNLLMIQDEYVEFFDSRIDDSGDMKEFVIMISQEFRHFIMGIHRTGFEDISITGLSDSAHSAIRQVMEKGMDMKCGGFVSSYRARYSEQADIFLCELAVVIRDEDNSKLSRIQERAERYMKKFIRDLQIEYMRYNAKN